MSLCVGLWCDFQQDLEEFGEWLYQWRSENPKKIIPMIELVQQWKKERANIKRLHTQIKQLKAENNRLIKEQADARKD